MIIQWFLKEAIIFSILYFIEVCGEAGVQIKQPVDAKYLEESNLSNTPNEENAYEKVKERIKDISKQESGRGFYNFPKNNSPRGFYYRKYMKIGKPKNEYLQYDNDKEVVYPLAEHNVPKNLTADKTKDIKESIQHDLTLSKTVAKSENSEPSQQEIPSIDSKQELPNILQQQNLSNIPQKQELFNTPSQREFSFLQESLMAPRVVKIDGEGLKEVKPVKHVFLTQNSIYLTNFGSFPTNISEKINANNRFFARKLLDFNHDNLQNNNYMDLVEKQENKLTEKNKKKEEKTEIRDKNKEENYNIKIKASEVKNVPNHINFKENHSGALELRPARSLRDLFSSKKINGFHKGNGKRNEVKKDSQNNIQQPATDNRRVRSCEVEMEDQQESFIPYEQLSIYHPKKSMTDQFILSDTMF